MPFGSSMKGFKQLVFLGLFASVIQTHGQTLSSTYSNNGIGIFNYQGLPKNMAMGEVGIGSPSAWNQNLVNPAFLPLNRLSSFQVGVEMDRRSMRSDDFENSEVAGGLRFLNYAFPIYNGKWHTAFGLAPYSSSNVSKFIETFYEEDSITQITVLRNSGGLSSFHWSNGFLLSKNLYAGMKMTFLFGSIDYSETVVLEGSNTFATEYIDRSTYSGLKYDFSLGYLHNIGETKRLNFGLTYGLEKELRGNREVTLASALAEEINESSEITQFVLPESVGFGFSYSVLNKLSIGSDIVSTQWSSGGAEGDDFINTLKLGIGGEWTPDYSNVSSYFKRVTYRLGFSIDQLPYKVQNQEIREVGINFGGSFPVGFSSLDVAFKYGTLGTTDNNLVRENYFRIVLGATMNSRWFIDRRYD